MSSSISINLGQTGLTSSSEIPANENSYIDVTFSDEVDWMAAAAVFVPDFPDPSLVEIEVLQFTDAERMNLIGGHAFPQGVNEVGLGVVFQGQQKTKYWRILFANGGSAFFANCAIIGAISFNV